MEIHEVIIHNAAPLARRHAYNRFHDTTPLKTTKAANLAAFGCRLAGDGIVYTRKADGDLPGFTASVPGLPRFSLDGRSESAPGMWGWKGVHIPTWN